MNMVSNAGASGNLTARLIKGGIEKAPLEWTIRNALRPQNIKGWLAKNAVQPVANAFGIGTMLAQLSIVVHKANGDKINYGVVGRRVVTTAGMNYIVDELQSSAGIANFKYHDCGTGGTAEAAGDTALITPYGGARTSGTQAEGASANIYKSAGTIAFTTTKAVVEHGLFSASSAGTLLDRTVFSAINVNNGDSIAFSYEITFTAGS